MKDTLLLIVNEIERFCQIPSGKRIDLIMDVWLLWTCSIERLRNTRVV
ncbi:MAG TPA: hypothetical protein PLJ29_11460 [Leptospiraceae bacterium]|nr:hypothetical protein [Leptospiraceae bacterium]HNI26970.1 hypothetical protein [Leptospiraceae bacterium]HNI99684.1 hypothetical protein [Leptospiraceae bacterium]HNN04996.1 hypothetical protein [Leptospiraceae bacterium]